MWYRIDPNSKILFVHVLICPEMGSTAENGVPMQGTYLLLLVVLVMPEER